MTKNVSVPEGYKKTEFGVIPEEWEVGKLSNISQVVMGQSPTGDTYNTKGEGKPLINGPSEFNQYHPTPVKWTSKPAKVCKTGDILFCVRGNTLGRMNFADQEYCIGRGIAAISGLKNVGDTNFIHLLLIKEETELYRRANGEGSTFPNIKKDQLNEIKLAIPSLQEQQKIASILSKVDEQIEQTEQIIEKTELLKKGLMQKLLTKGIGHTKFKKTELGEIPDEWEIKGLTKVFNLIDYRGRTPPFSENGIPYIGADNVKDAGIVFSKRRYVSEETYAKYMTRGIPNPDDILFTTEAPLGNVAQVPEYKFCFAQRVVVFQCKNDFSPLYFMYLLKNKIMQKQFLDWATGTTVTGISSKNMKFIKLYYPKNIQEQKQIGRVLESVDKYIDSEKENLLSLQELKKGLMQDLLTGKVRV